jgi:hypothetical protein
LQHARRTALSIELFVQPPYHPPDSPNRMVDAYRNVSAYPHPQIVAEPRLHREREGQLRHGRCIIRPPHVESRALRKELVEESRSRSRPLKRKHPRRMRRQPRARPTHMCYVRSSPPRQTLYGVQGGQPPSFESTTRSRASVLTSGESDGAPHHDRTRRMPLAMRTRHALEQRALVGWREIARSGSVGRVRALEKRRMNACGQVRHVAPPLHPPATEIAGNDGSSWWSRGYGHRVRQIRYP